MRATIQITAAAAAAALLAGCAGFQTAIAGPNRRTMRIESLSAQVRAGMSQQDVLARIGRPTYTFPVGLQRQTVWNYRFAPPEGDCTVFQVSFGNASGTVVETGQGYDRYCDGSNTRS